MSFFCLLCLLCIYCFFPPLSPVDPAATVDYTTATHDYVVDDSSTIVELPGKQSHFPSPTYRLLVYIYLLGICCYYDAFLFKCIACHCHPLLYFSFPMHPDIYKYYTEVNPALC